jgi:hypothetical protein
VVSAEAEQIQLQRKATHPSFSLSNNPGPKMPWDVTNEKTVNATLQSMAIVLAISVSIFIPTNPCVSVSQG